MFGCSDKLDSKKRILEELMGSLDKEEGMKLKPKASMVAVSVGKPKEDEMGEEDEKEEMSDEDLKRLIKQYIG